MNPVHEEEYKGYKIKIYYDEDAGSPREYDNIGIMVCWHRRYSLGDKNPFETPQDFERWEKKSRKSILVKLPLYLLDHSGISMSTGSFHDVWDSGQVGWIYTTKAQVKKIGPQDKSVEKLTEYLKGEVKEYDDFIRGNVYGYQIEKEGEELDGDEIDSCWGFIGDYDGEYSALSEAKSAVDYRIAHTPQQIIPGCEEAVLTVRRHPELVTV